MTIEIRVPTLGESVSEATVGRWFKQPGEAVKADEPLVELETDKVTLEVNAPAAGVLAEISVESGAVVKPDALLGAIGEGAVGAAPASAKPAAAPAPAAAARRRRPRLFAAPPPSPAAAKIAADSSVDLAAVAGSGKRGQVLKGDVLAALTEAPTAPPAPAPPLPPGAPPGSCRRRATRRTRAHDQATTDDCPALEGRAEQRRHADDLQRGRHERGDGFAHPRQGCLRKEARHEARLHGLFRQSLRRGAEGYSVGQCRDRRHRSRSTKTIITSASPSAPTRALSSPSCAIATGSRFAEIERTIADLGKRARDGALKIEEMQGGTFTITNGGVYGSLMSTPILNAPQSGILGMHKIQERPVAIAGKVEIRPMMYLALTYDHRIVDGKEAVTFLVRVKDALEDPARLILDI